MKKIVCFFIIFLLLATCIYSPHGIARDITERHEIEFSATESMNLTIKNIDGNIHVDSWEYDFISLDYDLSTQQEYGKEEFDKIELKTTETDNTLIIEIIYLEESVHIQVDMDLKIPYFVILHHIETVNGDLNIYDLDHEEYTHSSLSIKTTNGNIYLNDVIIDSGNLSISSVNGDLSLYDVSVPSGCIHTDIEKSNIYMHNVSFGFGSLSIDISEGYINLNDIIITKGDLSLTTQSGDISVYDIFIPQGSIFLFSGNGDFYIYNVELNTTGLTLQNHHGTLTIHKLLVPYGDFSVLSTEHDISLYDIYISQGNMNVTTKNGDIYCNDVFVDNGDVALSSDTGSLSAYDLSIPHGQILIKTVNGAVTLHDILFEIGDLSINTTEQGHIYLNDITIPNGDVHLSTLSGDISIYHLNIPQGIIDLNTDTGDVSIHNGSFTIDGLHIKNSGKGSIYLNDVNVSNGNVSLSADSGSLSVYDTIISAGVLNIVTNSGDINVFDTIFTDWTLTTNDADIYLNDLIIPKNSLTLTTTGDISVYDTKIPNGGIYLETENGDITAYDVTFNDWSFNTTKGDIFIGGFSIPTHDLDLTTTGDISISNIILEQGKLNINTEEGNIFVGSLDIDNRNLDLSTRGSISVYNTKASVQAQSVKGDIVIRNTTSFSSLSTEKGSIEAEIINIKDAIDISTNKGSIILEIDPELNSDLSMNVHSFIGAIFLTTLRSYINIQSSNIKQVEGIIGSGGHTISATIGDESNPNQIYGGFILLKKLRTPLFPLSFFDFITSRIIK